MTTIDERVVAMKFDNTQFERGVQTSMNSLNSLNKSLQLQGATKGLHGVSDAAKNVKLDHIANAVDAIGNRFRAMSVVAITALSTVTTQAVMAGQRLVKALTLDPIIQGYQEYELNLNSIQTILANTQASGATLKDVNSTLEELNNYADQTIYNFAEMAKNIGTFTAAGVDLDKSAASIKGIANLAALSGSNSQQASAAMYQLSQAIAAGRVTLEDWNSVVNAGMGGTVFQRALAQTAVAMGKLNANAVKLTGPMKNVSINGEAFRNSISAVNGESWLTSDVLTTTLSQFTGDLKDAELAAMGFSAEQIKSIQATAKTAQSAATEVKTMSHLMDSLKESTGSGWAQTWQIIFGDFEEAKKLWTGVNQVIGGFVDGMSQARNSVLTDWKALNGRTVLIEAVGNAFSAVMAIVTPIKDAFRQIFPAKTGQDLYNMTVMLRDFTANLKIGGETADRIRRIFAGVFAVLGLGWDILKGLIGVVLDLLGVVGKGSGGFLELVARAADWVVSMRTAIKEGKGLERFFKSLVNVLKKPIELLGNLGSFLLGIFDGFDAGPSGGGTGFTKFINDMWEDLKKFGKGASELFGDIGNWIVDALTGITWDDVLNTIMAGLGLALTGGIGALIAKMFGGLGGGGMLESIQDIIDGVTDTFSAMQNTLRAATLIQIAAAIAVLTISVVALSKIDPAALTASLTAIAVMMTQMGAALFAFEKFIKMDDIGKMYAIAGVMVVLGIAVNVLAGAVKKLADLNWDELARGLFGVTILIGALVVAVQNMPNDKKLISSSVSLVILAGAIKLLTSAVEDFSEMSWEEIAKGLVGVGALLVGLTLFTKYAKADKSGLASGAGLLLLASGIFVLSLAMEKFTDMSWSEIATALVTMGIAINLMAGSIRSLPPTAAVAAAGILVVAISLGMVADSLEQMGNMSWGGILKGLTALFGALTLIAAALYVIPPTAALGAAGVLIVAMSLADIGAFLEEMSKLSWSEIGKAMTVLAGTLLILAVGLTAMIAALPGAIATVVVAGALMTLVPVLQAFGAMSWEEIAKGLLMLAGIFVVLGAAGLILGPIVPILIALGGAIFLIGAAVLAAGVGVLAFGVGLTALSALGTVAVENIKRVLLELVGIIPLVLQKLGEGVIAFAEVIANGGPAITGAITAVLLSIITAIDTVAPKIINTLFKLLTLMLAKLMDFVPKMVQAGLRILTGVLNGIADNIYKIITVATKIATEFIRGLGDNLPKILDAGADFIIKFLKGLAKTIDSRSKDMSEAGADVAEAIIKGMVRGLTSGAGRVASMARDVAKSALNAAKNLLGINSPSKEFETVGIQSDDGLALGLDRGGKKVEKSARGVAGRALEAIRGSLSDMTTIFSKDVDLNPTITPVLDLSEVRKDAAQVGSFLGANAKPIAVSGSYSVARELLAKYEANRNANLDNGGLATHTESITYNQYNTSPKPLSASEIYRQTKNQLSVTKGALTDTHAY